MGHDNADRPFAGIIAAVLGAALVGAILLSLVAMNVAEAQTEQATAANGVLLPPPNFDPAAARDVVFTDSATVPATPAPEGSTSDGSTASDAPDANVDAPDGAADTPEDGGAVTTSLGGSDVAVSSVGGSHEVDGPNKRSRKK